MKTLTKILAVSQVAFLLFLPSVNAAEGDAAFKIDISVGKDAASSSVKASGKITTPLMPDDIKLFKLEDAALKKAVKKYWGKTPTDAYVSGIYPIKGVMLFGKYNWKPVERVLKVKSAKIIGIVSKPSIVSTYKCPNYTADPLTCVSHLTTTVENTAESNWSKSNTISVSKSISTDVKFLGAGVGSDNVLSYSHSWGKGGSKSKSTTLSVTGSTTSKVPPGKTGKMELNASQGHLTIRVTYEASLVGTTAVHYSGKYKKHYYWDFGIAGVMQHSGISNSIEYHEDITVGFYTDASIAAYTIANE
jgi:hypothetical protein